MTVNVGTIGHVDHGRNVLVVGSGSGIIGRKLGLALLAAMPAIMVSHCHHSALPSLPTPKPAKRLTAADLERIEAAEAKRQRRIERNKQRGMQG